MEAVEEFKVETSGFRAEDAHTGGGVFKFTIKSGTNKFHGSAFGIMRNEIFDANDWNNNLRMADSIARDPANRAAYGEVRSLGKLQLHENEQHPGHPWGARFCRGRQDVVHDEP